MGRILWCLVFIFWLPLVGISLYARQHLKSHNHIFSMPQRHNQTMLSVNFVIHIKPRYRFTIINSTKSIELKEKLWNMNY